jgi:serine/threonine protein kinase
MGIEIGEKLIDKFEILSHIGAGGCGSVVKAKDLILLEDIAIKTLNPELSQNNMIKNMFLNEAKICLKLIHKNIIRVREVNIHNGIFFMVMDYIDGIDLKEFLETNKVEPKEFYLLMRDVLLGLDYAHEFTIHRDIKPANIMVSKADNRFILMDFGISKALSESQISNNTVIGAMGTQTYMSPEQALNAKDIDKRTDIYSIGILFYKTLTGVTPQSTAIEIPKEPHLINNKIPVQMSNIILKMVAPKVENRYSCIADVVNDMDKIFLDNVSKIDISPRPIVSKNKNLDGFILIEGGSFFRGSGNESKIDVDFDIENLANTIPDYPVVNISWQEAKDYANFYGYELPTEAQWEKSAKGKKDNIYPWGNDFDITKANVMKPTGSVVSVYEFEDSQSEYGCIQMAGNIWEWCLDDFDEKFYEKNIDTNPSNIINSDIKVVRGGSFDFIPIATRCAHRHKQNIYAKQKNVGFRVVKNLEDVTNV